ncbi:DUF1415 domain-containing protein [Photobacterium galatheae]|uniref:Uncharacterized protein n=1 Tax=Photobacterium galatheae TaxID=1654360 RepID=A0A066RRL8_9GAMM|nr:DUF1415 domain-containing protein [Photobacterium galatheae]KDM91741.1 hypothetical protein EA58_10255 [Photobacterium galatheae]MCM0149851.1 DUF1415 domain-containing protein [Photobacterium galatheae]
MSYLLNVEQWLDDVVIGLNLCPFAAKPRRNEQIRIAIYETDSLEELLEGIYQEIKRLDSTPVCDLDTSLVVCPNLLQDFDEYNQFLDMVEALISQCGKEGIYQVASFHPDYCFYGTAPGDAENLTNRAPYPIFHFIREDSMEKVLAHYPDPDAIPERNIEKMKKLTDEEIRRLFPYLISKN